MIKLENIKDWIEAGAVDVGSESGLTKGTRTGNYALITETAVRFVEEVRKVGGIR